MTDMETASKHAVEGRNLFLEWSTMKDMLVEVEVTVDDAYALYATITIFYT